MRLIVGYLATPSGDDGLALGVRLARTLGAALDLCMVLPHDRLVTVGGFDQFLAEDRKLWEPAVKASGVKLD